MRINLDEMAEEFAEHFRSARANPKEWSAWVQYVALDRKVLAVARTRIEGAWCAYIRDVPGDAHQREAMDVLMNGAKLSEEVALAIFPQFKGVPYAR